MLTPVRVEIFMHVADPRTKLDPNYVRAFAVFALLAEICCIGMAFAPILRCGARGEVN